MQRCCHWPAESLLTWPAWCALTLWSPWETAAAADTKTSTYFCRLNEIRHILLQTFTFPTKLCGTNLFNFLFKTFLQVLVAPDEFVKNLKRKNQTCLSNYAECREWFRSIYLCICLHGLHVLLCFEETDFSGGHLIWQGTAWRWKSYITSNQFIIADALKQTWNFSRYL